MSKNDTSKEKISFRTLNADDVDRIAEIDEQIVMRKRTKLFKEEIAREIRGHAEETLGAFTDEGKLIGYIIAETKVYIYGQDDLSAWIILLGVDPEYQGIGIGTKLARRMIEYFSKRGIKTIRTITQWAWGDLVEFFANSGFELSDYLTLEMRIGEK